ncbi:MAG: 6,7-dimethyl-8-ribityllumazine synthase [Candidatus Aminicenantia bacterium]
MANIYEGRLDAKDLKIGIVLSRFNEFITERLLHGALDALKKLGANEEAISIFKVPGSFEIPIVVKKLASSKKFDCIICLSTLIRGDTPHFDFLSAEVTKTLSQIGIEEGIAISFGVLTVDSIEQAIERAGTKMGNKGWDAALSAVELATLMRSSNL